MSQVVKGVPLRYQRGSLNIRDLPLGGGDFEWNAGAALAGLAMDTALGNGEAPVRVHRQGSHHPPLIHRFPPRALGFRQPIAQNVKPEQTGGPS